MKRVKTEDSVQCMEDTLGAIKLYIHPNGASHWECSECGRTFETGDHIYESDESGDDLVYDMFCTACNDKINTMQADEERARKRSGETGK